MSKATIVEYLGKQSEYRCGYCKSSDTNYSHGMWGHILTPQDYQNLLNRGWRRSGKYLYKPTNNRTCCPAYTINCHALEFQLTKSQKKVLKRFNKFLLEDGMKSIPVKSSSDKSKETNDLDMSEIASGSGENITSFAPKNGQIPSNINAEKMDVVKSESSKSKKIPQEGKEKPAISKVPEAHTAADSQSILSNDPSTNTTSKPENSVVRSNFKKAKDFRIERRKQKLLLKGIDSSTFDNAKKQVEAKTLEDFLTPSSDLKKKFVIKTVKVNTEEFEETFNLELSLYRSYQMTVHQDKEEDCTAKQFRRFLCDSPFTKTGSDDEIYGTYHQQYYIDDTMIGVGVVDIIPDCVSSVYFFYSPSYMFLSLGTYGALREIAYVRELQSLHPSIRYYYMGFYIHSCVKMRYKGCFTPSYLLCPEEFTWHLLDDNIRSKLSASKYSRLHEGSEKKSAIVNVNEARVLFRGHRMLYETYKDFTGADDTEDVQEYANLVGDVCSKSITLYRTCDDD